MQLQLFRTLRSLFPSWRFFDRPGYPDLCEARFRDAQGWTEWQGLHLPPTSRSVTQLFFNPGGNLAMAWQSAVDQLAHELEEPGEDFPAQSVARSVAYAVVRDGVEAWARGRPFQFRITCQSEVLLLSPILGDG